MSSRNMKDASIKKHINSGGVAGNEMQFGKKEEIIKPEKEKPARNRRLMRAEEKLEHAQYKLEEAKTNIPTKRRIRKTSYVDEKTGKAKLKLQFEKFQVSQREHLKGALPLRPVKAVGNAFIVNAHRKLYQAENENVGIKAAHRLEMGAEAGVRSALRHHKTAPYRKAAKMEKAVSKKSAKAAYQKALSENPKLRGNPIKKAIQKRQIKKQYAKAARESQKAIKNAAKAGENSAKAIGKITQAAAKHPVVAVAAVIAMLLMLFVLPVTSVCSSVGGGITSVVAMTTFIAADEEMLAAERMYAEMEEDLQYKMDNYETLYPGYDEYHINPDRIWHDPYVLMAILHAFHEGEWTVDQVEGTLKMLFGKQYILYEEVVVERRYRTVKNTYISPYTGLPYEVTETEAYDWYICKVQLINENLSHLPVFIMSEGRLSRYAQLMWTRGNRPDLFPQSQYPDASVYRKGEMHEVPQAYLDADPTFAAIVKEANKYIGMPYVWGGYNPNTSFDCSGFVSWVYNQTGWDFGRLGAQGLHSYSKPVSKENAKPGDLIFFYGTYNAPNPLGATHVGIYVGDGMMVHAGDPVGYTSIESKYWQEHFLSYGRMY